MGTRVTDPMNATATAGIFATYPQPYLSTAEGFADQVCELASIYLYARCYKLMTKDLIIVVLIMVLLSLC